jgi:hypothetical protein
MIDLATLWDDAAPIPDRLMSLAEHLSGLLGAKALVTPLLDIIGELHCITITHTAAGASPTASDCALAQKPD